ncbi:Pyridoxamine 5'-phosphate oxidase family protein [Rhynchospora pubera]|uniref:Pyridoxamine 5'-phosphate oxidase family protein n=1 Tax=Rhynchospora pubera TaxID=906938 RepID=A0AAV8D333_9POAL|nr:Pyridoxamine 5'-phosphate oxidase family protein [Rhynchospora pubera]
MEAAALWSASASWCSSFLAEPEHLHHPHPVSVSVSEVQLQTRTRRTNLKLSLALSRPRPRPVHLLQALANGPSSESNAPSPSPSSGLDFNITLSPNSINTTEDVNANVTSSVSGAVTTGSRAGLFRTPISGGVHSATSAHDLPPPALAVRNLMEQARFAHLCTTMSKMHHRRAGYPFGSLVDFAPDSMGHPIFSLSPLAIHTRNLLADPRCTLVVQIPGWSGLSNARVTIFGDVVPLPADHQDWARQQYIAKHQQWASQQWGNFYYYRMQTISDIYFIGGFGTVAWLDVKEYEAIQPDKIAAIGGEQNLKELNAMFSKPLKELLSAEVEIDDAALISVDSKGTDIRVRQGAQFNIQRLSFEVDNGVETLEDAKRALQKIIKKGSKLKPHK